MTWLTWRQLRTQVAIGWTAVAAAALVFLVTRDRLPDASGSVYDRLTSSDRNLYIAGVLLVAAAPALIGAFWGAPLVARELENGTHQLVWNQSVTRTRWLAVKLALAVLAAALAVGLLSLVVTWWSGTLDGSQASTRGSLPSRLEPVPFGMRGIVPVAYAVFSMVVGVLAGLLLRRTVPAMAATLALVAFAQIAAPLWIRPDLAPPERQILVITMDNFSGIEVKGDSGPAFLTVAPPQPGDWVLANRTVDPAGAPVTTLPAQITDCFPGPGPNGEPPPRKPIREEAPECFRKATEAGYRQELVFHPASRFWQLQWTETAVFLGLSALLAGACFARIRKLS